MAAAVAVAAASLLYPLYYWAPAGLETTLFTALLTATTWALVARSNWAWAILAACLGLVRPEGPFLACALVGLAGLANGRGVLRLGPIGLALGPALAWLIFRRAFYGDWLPNTYYAKATGGLLFKLEAGLVYSGWALGGLAVAGVATWLAGVANRRALSALALLTLAVACVVAGGGDWMWHGRMLLPVLPSLVGLEASGIARAPTRRRPVLILVCVFVWSAFLPRASLLADAFAGKQLVGTAYQRNRAGRATRIPSQLSPG